MSLHSIKIHSGTAMYVQIARSIEKNYIKGEESGSRLPSEGELARRFGVNRHTLRRAVDELVNAGMIERRRGLGLFVAEGTIDYPVGSKTRFTQNLADLGRLSESRLVEKTVIKASRGITSALEVSENEPVLWIETLRYVDGAPFCIVSHFLPETFAADIFSDYTGGSIHEQIMKHHGGIRRLESLVTAILPLGNDARLLHIPPTQPVLRVKSVNTLESDGRPVEYAITRFRADRVKLRINP